MKQPRTTSGHAKVNDLSFANEVRWRVERLAEKGFSRSEVSRDAGLSRGTITSIIDHPDQKPGYDTVLGLVQVFNRLGVPWDLNEALAAAGMRKRNVARVGIDYAAMGIATLHLPVFDADKVGAMGISYGAQVGDIPISTTQTLIRIPGRAELLHIETVGEADETDTMVVRRNGKMQLLSLAEALAGEWEILGKVIGHFVLGAVPALSGVRAS